MKNKILSFEEALLSFIIQLEEASEAEAFITY